MRKKPLIGITGGMGQAIYSLHMEQIPMQQHRLNDSYVQAVIQAGGIPVILPVCEDPELMHHMVDSMDGVLLSGGGDMDPACYGKRATGRQGFVSPRRDIADLAVAEYVLKLTDKPLLGICRGVQVMNVALGGSLHIDLPDAGMLDHALNMYPRNMTSHAINIEAGTRLSEIMGSGSHGVNSFHHQAVDVLGEGLIVTARSVPDEVIEAVELSGPRFAVGVQWHPEELRATEKSAVLFQAFIAAAQP